jgi:hypothetical protein
VTDAWDSPEAKAARIAQAEALRQQAGKGGLRFEAYLPPDLAEWLLSLIERGVATLNRTPTFAANCSAARFKPRSTIRALPSPAMKWEKHLRDLCDTPVMEAACLAENGVMRRRTPPTGIIVNDLLLPEPGLKHPLILYNREHTIERLTPRYGFGEAGHEG